jgi:hypothetical protein
VSNGGFRQCQEKRAPTYRENVEATCHEELTDANGMSQNRNHSIQAPICIAFILYHAILLLSHAMLIPHFPQRRCCSLLPHTCKKKMPRSCRKKKMTHQAQIGCALLDTYSFDRRFLCTVDSPHSCTHATFPCNKCDERLLRIGHTCSRRCDEHDDDDRIGALTVCLCLSPFQKAAHAASQHILRLADFPAR